MNQFELLQKTQVSKELRNRIETKVLECLLKAQKKFGANKCTKIPEIRYDTTGKTAGWACWNNGNPYIRINPILLNENVEEMIDQTVPHEVAHIVVNEIWPESHERTVDLWSRRWTRKIAPHGWEWKSVMHCFGCSPDRCHKMDVTTIQSIRTRNVREFVWKCGCMDHVLTGVKHKRASAGTKYRCKRCGSSLTYYGEKIKDYVKQTQI